MFQGMIRFVLTLSIIGYFFPAFAISFFSHNTDASQTASTDVLPKVMSPSEFSNKVNSLKQTAQSQLTQQAQDILSAGSDSTSTTPPVSGAPVPATAPPTTPPTTPTPAPTVVTSPAPPPALTTVPTTTPQNDTTTPSTPYSGFGAGQNTSAPNMQPASGGKQGGWNIQY